MEIKPAKILVVDDEPQLVELLKMRLEVMGYSVLTAYDGQEGLAKATQEHPDLILLDIMMPKMDGCETLSRLKQQPETRAIPVIMLTAKGDTHSITRLQALRATDYFIKPFDATELLAFIRKYLP